MLPSLVCMVSADGFLRLSVGLLAVLLLAATAPSVGALTSAVDATSTVGTIVTVAGIGEGGRSDFVELATPVALAFDPSTSSLYFSDEISAVIRRVDAANTLHIVAGTGESPADFIDDGLSAKFARVVDAGGLCVSSQHTGAGTVGTRVYVAASTQQRVLYIDTSGIIHSIAGTGVRGWNGDGAATSARLNAPQDVTYDPVSDTVWIADRRNSVIRRLASGQLVTVVGVGGVDGEGVLGGAGTAARLSIPYGVTFDPRAQVLYIADTGNSRVLRYGIANGIVVAVAGIPPSYSYNGDGIPASSATLASPIKVIVLPLDGSLLISDYGQCRVRMIANTSIISTLLGTGQCATDRGPNGLPPSQTRIGSPWGIAADSSTPGLTRVFVTDYDRNVVRLVAGGNTSTVLGSGLLRRYSGDGDAALSSYLAFPYALALEARSQTLIVADPSDGRVRRVDLVSGRISRVAGTGESGFGGDGGQAVDAIVRANSAAVCPSGRILLGDSLRSRVRSIDHITGIISRLAGNGGDGLAGDGYPADQSLLNSPSDVECNLVPAVGEVIWIADSANHRVRAVTPNGIIQTVAGGGASSQDGVAASGASIDWPQALAYDVRSGDLYIYCAISPVLKKLTREGLVYRVAGIGVSRFSVDGALASQSALGSISGLDFDPASGNLYIAESDTNRVRVIMANGTLTTVAGGVGGSLVLPGLLPTPALHVSLNFPTSTSFDPIEGRLFVCDYSNRRIQMVQLESLLLLGKPCVWPQVHASIWLPSFAAPCLWNASNTTASPASQAAAAGYTWFMQRATSEGRGSIRIPCASISLSPDLLQENAPCIRTASIACSLPYALVGARWVMGFTVNNVTSHIPSEVLQTGGVVIGEVWPTVSNATLSVNMSAPIGVNPVWGEVLLQGGNLRPLPGREQHAGLRYNGQECAGVVLDLVGGQALAATCNMSGSSLYWHPPTVQLYIDDVGISVGVLQPLPPPLVVVNTSELVWGTVVRLAAPHLGRAHVANITFGISSVPRSHLMCQALGTIDGDTLQCRVTMLHEAWFGHSLSVCIWSFLSPSPVCTQPASPLLATRPLFVGMNAPTWLSRLGGDTLQLQLPYSYTTPSEEYQPIDMGDSAAALPCRAWIGGVHCSGCTLLVSADGASSGSGSMSAHCLAPPGDLPLQPLTVQIQGMFNITDADSGAPSSEGTRRLLLSYTPPVAIVSDPIVLDMPDLRAEAVANGTGSFRKNIAITFDTPSLGAIHAMEGLQVGGVLCASAGIPAAPTASSSSVMCAGWDAVAQSRLFVSNNVSHQATLPLLVSFVWANVSWSQNVGLFASLRPEVMTVQPSSVQAGATIFLSGRSFCPQDAIVGAVAVGLSATCFLGNTSTVSPVRIYIGPVECEHAQISVGAGVDTATCTTSPVDVDTFGYPDLAVTVCRGTLCSNDMVVIRYPSGARVVANAPLPSLFIPSDPSVPVPLSPHIQGRVISDGGILVPGAPCTLIANGHSGAVTNSSGSLVAGMSDARAIITFTDAIVQLPFTITSISLSVICMLPTGDQAFALMWTANVSCISFAFAVHPVDRSVAQQPLPVWSTTLLSPPMSPDLAILAAALVPNNTSLKLAHQIEAHAETSAIASYYETAVVCRAELAATNVGASSNVFVQDNSAVMLVGAGTTVTASGAWSAPFTSLTILGNQTRTYSLQVSCYIGKYSIPPHSFSFDLSLMGCEVGTAPNGVVCTRCPDGFFSLGGVDAACHRCPQVGVRCVGGLLSPLFGYFRPPEATERRAVDNSPLFDQFTELHECYSSAACTLNTTTLEYGCGDGYMGPLCSVCENLPHQPVKYARTGTTCSPCREDGVNQMLVIGAIVILAGGLIYWALRPPTGDKADSNIALRVLLSYLQTLGSIRTLRTETLSASLGWTSATSSTPLAIAPFQCTFQWSSDTQFLVLASMPFLIACFVVITLLSKAVCYARTRPHDGTHATTSTSPSASGSPSVSLSGAIELQAVASSDTSAADATVSRTMHVGGHDANPFRRFFETAVDALERISFWQRTTAITVLAISVTYMPILTSAMRQLDCDQVAIAGVQYVRSDMTLACEDHARAPIRFFCKFVLVVLGGGFPLATFILLARVSIPSLYEPEFRSAYGFLYVGYKFDPLLATRRTRRNGILVATPQVADSKVGMAPQFSQQMLRRVISPSHATRCQDGLVTCTNTRTHLVWWESVVLLRKCAVALVSVFILDVRAHLVAMVLILLICLQLQQKYNPYAKRLFNRLEWCALAASCSSAAIGVLLVPDGNTLVPAATVNAATWLLILINLPTIGALGGVWLYLRWHQSKATVRRVLARAQSAPTVRKLMSHRKLPTLVQVDPSAERTVHIGTRSGIASPSGCMPAINTDNSTVQATSLSNASDVTGLHVATTRAPATHAVASHRSVPGQVPFNNCVVTKAVSPLTGDAGRELQPDINGASGTAIGHSASHVMVRNPLRRSVTGEWKPTTARANHR